MWEDRVESKTEEIREGLEKDRLLKIFTYHAPVGNQTDRYVALRKAGLDMAMLILKACPYSRERSLAITKLQEVVMFANAAIAINEEGE